MTTRSLAHLPLSSAFLCQDCESIGNCATQCPACASHALLNLSGILDRQVSPDGSVGGRMPVRAIRPQVEVMERPVSLAA